MKTITKAIEQLESLPSFDEELDELDIQVRQEFNLEDEPLHLWERYYEGDANPAALQRAAEEKGLQDVDALLDVMTERLIERAEALYKQKTSK